MHEFGRGSGSMLVFYHYKNTIKKSTYKERLILIFRSYVCIDDPSVLLALVSDETMDLAGAYGETKLPNSQL